MDVQMPVMDGFTATRTVRAEDHGLPIVALTADAMKGFEQQCLDAGYADYFTKPIDIDSFVARLAEVLGAQPTPVESPGEQAGPVFAPADDGRVPPETLDTASNPAAGHDHLTELAARLAARLGGRLNEMASAWQARDYKTLAELGHWLKGSGGAVGFHAFTAPARALEDAAKAQDDQAIGRSLHQLRDIAAQIPGVGLPAPATGPAPAERPQTVTEDAPPRPQDVADAPIVSRFAGHPRMQPLIDKFLLRLAVEAEAVKAAWEEGDVATVEAFARRLKGAAGTLGFDAFTEPAAELANSAAAQDRNAIAPLLNDVLILAARLQQGDLSADRILDTPVIGVTGG